MQVHKLQQIRGGEQADDGKQHSHNAGKYDGGMGSLGDFVWLIGAEILADDHACAGGKAGKRANEHIHNGRHRSHGGKGFVTDKITYDPGIYHIVKLLEQVTQHQRQRKSEQVTEDAALGHIHAGFFTWQPYGVRGHSKHFLII